MIAGAFIKTFWDGGQQVEAGWKVNLKLMIGINWHQRCFLELIGIEVVF